MVLILILVLFFFNVSDVNAAGFCPSGQECSGSGSFRDPNNCSDTGTQCRTTSYLTVHYTCGADCTALIWAGSCSPIYSGKPPKRVFAGCSFQTQGLYQNCCVTAKPSSCTPSCSGKTCGDDGCGGSCGTCASGVCNAGNCCTNTAPDKPVLSSPADTTQIRVGILASLSWDAIASWGTACSSASNNYQLCVSSNQTSCDLVNYANNGTVTTATWTPGAADPYVTWSVRANNGQLTNESTARNVCVEGFNVADTNYVSLWSACGANTHKRTRTCTETCGTDDCTGVVLEEDCLAEIRGTVFDATDMVSCPSYDPITGYIVGADTTLTANNRTFGFTDQSNTPTHPWSPFATPTTNAVGNYSLITYAPSTYSYDFSSLFDIYIVGTGPKLACTSAAAVVPSNIATCKTQPCTTVNNMSFGFNRYFKGWWQAVGASVHAEKGAKSVIPSLITSEQSLILPDANSRRGVLSYGTLTNQMYGLNTNAKASASLWQVQSNYEGTVYDYDYFALQFKKYPTTVWDGTGVFGYTDNGKGYEIVKVTGNITNFNFSPTGTQKVIFLVNGSVTVSTPSIAVPVGAFMTVIASGDITFTTTATRADGWYLANNINIPCIDLNNDLECDRTDTQFLGNGSFVAWKGINMSRDMGAIPNITEAAEKFTYRTDLYTNAPEAMKNLTKRYKSFVP